MYYNVYPTPTDTHVHAYCWQLDKNSTVVLQINVNYLKLNAVDFILFYLYVIDSKQQQLPKLHFLCAI